MLNIFDNMPKMLKRIKRDTYTVYFDDFESKNLHIFTEMLNTIGTSENKEATATELAENFVTQIKDNFKNKKNKVPKSIQISLNMFMIYYVFPLILKCDDESSTLLADKICTSWRQNFEESNISYANYETIHSSFKEKVLGLF